MSESKFLTKRPFLKTSEQFSQYAEKGLFLTVLADKAERDTHQFRELVMTIVLLKSSNESQLPVLFYAKGASAAERLTWCSGKLVFTARTSLSAAQV